MKDEGRKETGGERRSEERGGGGMDETKSAKRKMLISFFSFNPLNINFFIHLPYFAHFICQIFTLS